MEEEKQQSSSRGVSPPEGGQRWAAVVVHAALPGSFILGLLWALFSGSESGAEYVGIAVGWGYISIIGLILAFFFSKAYPAVRFHAAQSLLWAVVFGVTAGIAVQISMAVGLIIFLSGAAVAALGAYRIWEGKSWRYPVAAFLVEARMR